VAAAIIIHLSSECSASCFLRLLCSPMRMLDQRQMGEALVFALLSTRHGMLSGNHPALTGASHPLVLGQITPGDNYADLIRRTAASALNLVTREAGLATITAPVSPRDAHPSNLEGEQDGRKNTARPAIPKHSS
jgi:hypothetical protein